MIDWLVSYQTNTWNLWEAPVALNWPQIDKSSAKLILLTISKIIFNFIWVFPTGQ